jgi:hypothetical protein
MALLGRALANHLVKLKGLYSIELPAQLMGEMEELITVCNKGTTQNRALLVLPKANFGV